ncbi:hypothetical protein BATDEDRAFT_31495 [Batrachochytrium dendrobatidis JAM81]|uniref:SCP domain-containing protein n=2 Tax=Batrachochytrium dendrobatidis TaxID=109871 RepID=F4NXP9_BATDJ|nr:uncharacterized protein BATDEDRAFT_31495 [Batrachochytrium dendrobatidis JAM81]EGF81884.1 hypothetical protein BATDEDRAFT_31495 [Batrachochytrium dendrobatidis JAM81]|eukprot:XP_006677384.1 hypothetical protein BATDEDRAFT_31495 [Batrachochytrium dendrobatidis JAM81]
MVGQGKLQQSKVKRSHIEGGKHINHRKNSHKRRRKIHRLNKRNGAHRSCTKTATTATIGASINNFDRSEVTPTTLKKKSTTTPKSPTPASKKPVPTFKSSVSAHKKSAPTPKSPAPAPRKQPSPVPKRPTPTPKPAPPPGPKPRKGGNTGIGAVEKSCLDAHNYYRAMVGVPPLSWSTTLQNIAQRYAQELMGNPLKHSSLRTYGENLDRMTGATLTCEHAMETFFNEYQHYSGERIFVNAQFEKYGHYTQLIWPSTNSVGCGMANDGHEWNFVCEYYPPGNYVGQTAPTYRP